MKSRLVIWGETVEERKVLLLFDLIEQDDKVLLHIIPHVEVPEELYQELLGEWRKGKEVKIPENAEIRELPLELGEQLLPEDIKTKQSDLIQKTQAEWHFYVASHKMYQMYKSQAEELKERVDRLEDYSSGVWEELKEYWGKVQDQIKDRNIFGFHIDDLRKRTDEMFDEMKVLRKKKEESLKEETQETFDAIQESLDKVEEKIKKGLSLKPIFEELKKIQKSFKKEKLHRRFQNILWDRIDRLFKEVKEKRFGDSKTSVGKGKVTKLQRRLDGLEKVVKNMHASIEHEEDNLFYENKRKDNSSGELEIQLRQAKLKMIEERLSSKKSKLEDILKTREHLTKQLESAIVEEQKEAEEEKIKKAKEEIEKRIKSEIKENLEKIDFGKRTSVEPDDVILSASAISKIVTEEE